MQPRTTVIALLACGLAEAAFATVPGVNQELDRLYQQARELLDGPRSGHPTAARLLETIIERDPEYAAAYVEAARYTLKSSYLQTVGSEDLFEERGIEAATRLLDNAIALEPTFADTFVLYGYVLRAQDRNMLGLTALAEAERLGSTSSWLPYNRALVLESLGRSPEARLQHLASRNAADPGSSQHLLALEGLTRVGRSPEEVDSFHRELLDLQPTNVYVRANYADFLLRSGRIDQAIDEARKALAIGSTDFARGRLAVALYTKASELLLDQRDVARANEYFAAGDSTLYSPKQALISAAVQDSTFIAVLGLHEHGVDINTTDELGRSALFFALQDGDQQHVRQLLDRGARTEIRDRDGWTPLLVAVDAGSLQLVEILLDAGADPNFRGRDDRTPIEAATAAGDTAILARLTAAGGRAAEEPWRGTATAARNGSAAGIDRAIKYLQFEEPENIGVLLALQEALLADPVGVLELAAEFGFVLNKICGPTARSAGAPSVARRLEAVQRGFAATRAAIPPPAIAACMSELAKVGTEFQLPSTPGPLRSTERSELLATARRLFEESRPHESGGERATELAYLLYADLQDEQAHLLVAEIELGNALAGGTSSGSNAPESLKPTIAATERALAANGNYADAFALYSHVLRLENHQGLADLVLRRAESLGNAGPWLAVYQAESAIAAGDFQNAARRLEAVAAGAASRRLQAQALRQLIEAFRRDGQHARARATFERLVAIDPENTEPFRHYLLFSLHENRDFGKAAEIGLRINNIGGRVDDDGWLALALFAQGADLLARGTTVGDAATYFKRGNRLVDDLPAIMAGAAEHPSTFFVVKTMREAGLSVNSADQQGNTLLLNAVARGDRDAVTELLALGAEVDMPGSFGQTPLQLAIMSRHEAIALQLLAAGADGRTLLPDGSSPADLAFQLGMEGLRSRLLDARLGRYPDWNAFLDGVRTAQPVHVRRALTLEARPEVLVALEDAMRAQPRTVLELANESGELRMVCGKSSEADAGRRERSIRDRVGAVTRVRDLQIALELAQSDGVLERCLGLLALEASRQ